MNFKKLFRGPFIYVILAIAAVWIGSSLVTMNGYKPITTDQGLTMLAEGKVKEATIYGGDQRVDMKLTAPDAKYGSEVQFFWVTPRGQQVITAIDNAKLADGYNDDVPHDNWFLSTLGFLLPILLIGVFFWFMMGAAGGGGAVHLGAGHRLVRDQDVGGLLHVRHGEGLRAALPLRPADAARLEGVSAVLAALAGADRRRVVPGRRAASRRLGSRRSPIARVAPTHATRAVRAGSDARVQPRARRRAPPRAHGPQRQACRAGARSRRCSR